MRTLIRAVALVASPLLLLGCATGSSSGTATPTASPTVTTTEFQYADAPPAFALWSEPKLDVVAVPGGTNRPLVVILPPHNMLKDDPATSAIARSLAEHGVVAVVANWTQLEEPSTEFTDPATMRRFAEAGQSVAGCAVSYAVARAAGFGADARHLVLVGDLYGANTAAMTALTSPAALPGCRSTAAWHATGLAVTDGDWLTSMEVLDPVGATAIKALSPWSVVDHAVGMQVTLLSTKAAAKDTARCEKGAPWVAARDPSGTIRARLTATGAFADGCVNLPDAARALGATFAAVGVPAQLTTLANADGASTFDNGAHFLSIGPSDLDAVTTAVLATTR